MYLFVITSKTNTEDELNIVAEDFGEAINKLKEEEFVLEDIAKIECFEKIDFIAKTIISEKEQEYIDMYRISTQELSEALAEIDRYRKKYFEVEEKYGNIFIELNSTKAKIATLITNIKSAKKQDECQIVYNWCAIEKAISEYEN